MSLLNSVLGAAMGGGQGGGTQAALMNLVLGMLQGGGGSGGAGAGGAGGLAASLGAALGGGGGGGAGGLAGLGQLVEQFQRGGLGDVMGSWISTGQNLPISPEQLGSVLGNERIAGMASQLGVNQGDLLGQLSQLLPQVVDKLTPQGQIPQQPDLGQLGSLLGGLMGKR
ncbi:MAG: YidB family protein [Rubrivivax sp.]|jgi:uncharacterized protein YidB (DUF937 family)|nr:YidB family protein [Rubrivivax sp.]